MGPERGVRGELAAGAARVQPAWHGAGRPAGDSSLARAQGAGTAVRQRGGSRRRRGGTPREFRPRCRLTCRRAGDGRRAALRLTGAVWAPAAPDQKRNGWGESGVCSGPVTGSGCTREWEVQGGAL